MSIERKTVTKKASDDKEEKNQRKSNFDGNRKLFGNCNEKDIQQNEWN